MTAEITETKTATQLTLFDLEQLETRIRAGLAAFVEVGEALQKAQEGNAHRLRGYGSFEEYCEREFQFTLRHGQRLIQGAQVAQKVEEITGEKPHNEAVARVLSKIVYANNAKTMIGKVVKELLRTHKRTIGTATAEMVAKAVAAVTKPGKTQTGGQADMGIADEPPPINTMPTFVDFCPHCGGLPESYTRTANGWHCPDCDGKVMLGVVSAA